MRAVCALLQFASLDVGKSLKVEFDDNHLLKDKDIILHLTVT